MTLDEVAQRLGGTELQHDIQLLAFGKMTGRGSGIVTGRIVSGKSGAAANGRKSDNDW